MLSGHDAAFGAALVEWRKRRNVSLRGFAQGMGYSFSHISKIERGERAAGREFAERADRMLGAQGSLTRVWYDHTSGVLRPRQLPPAMGRLIGRDHEISAVNHAVEAREPGKPAVVVIDGPAGAGKTALALHWAHRTAERFVDGHLHVDLHGFSARRGSVDPSAVLLRFCTVLGDPASVTTMPDTLEERAALYRSLLRDRRVLLVLDNAASAEQVEHLLPGADRCAVLVTSRRILSRLSVVYDARRVMVGPLSPFESLSLIEDRIGAQRADAERDALAELTRLCGHLPLAVRIAADLADRYPHRSIADLVADLHDPVSRLETLEIEDVLSWSYHDLPPRAARTFRLLGLSVGRPVSIPAVAALTGMSTTAARQDVHILVSVHLAQARSPDLVVLPDLVGDYARNLAHHDPDRESAERRLLSWLDEHQQYLGP